MRNFRNWYTREPIVIHRWVLQAKYLLFIVLAWRVAASGLTTLEETAGRGYLLVWAVAIILGSTVAFLASLQDKWGVVEKWADIWIAAWLMFVAVSSLMLGREGGFWIVLVVTLLPAGRAIGLFVKAGNDANPTS